jgi:hypothetical protein
MENAGTMKSHLKLDVDYTGVYIRPANFHPKEHEILMADTKRFRNEETDKSTACQALLSRVAGNLLIEISGSFQERPITKETMDVRVDIYINLKYSSEIITWLEQTFNPSLIEKLQIGTNPTRYIRGSTLIPLEGKPSIEIYLIHSEFFTPRWKIETNNSRAFLDIECDKKFARVQLHLGIRFSSFTLTNQTKTEQDHIYPVNGIIQINKQQTERLYSYLKTYAV